jgi:hypothetical protein
LKPSTAMVVNIDEMDTLPLDQAKWHSFFNSFHHIYLLHSFSASARTWMDLISVILSVVAACRCFFICCELWSNGTSPLQSCQ